ncbi:MAG: pyridoxamine kinase [Sutterella sp.]|nr:pyridoxamine kinase [Sutterella sp.]
MPNLVKRVAAIHDMSGVGRVSLTAVIPVLSAMGIQTCPLPTAILSSHTQYPHFSFIDLTDNMVSMINEWKALDLRFDAIYSGYLGSTRQIEILENFLKDFRREDTLVVVDPVLGDNGKLYATFDETMIKGMQQLVRSADVITPNLTEAFALLDRPYKTELTTDELKATLRDLAKMGPKTVIITSVPIEGDEQHTSVCAYDTETDRFWRVICQYMPAHYPGTGDTFTSVLTGALLQGDSLPMAIDRAAQFILQGIRATFGYKYDNRDGILLERVLPALEDTRKTSTYEWF